MYDHPQLQRHFYEEPQDLPGAKWLKEVRPSDFDEPMRGSQEWCNCSHSLREPSSCYDGKFKRVFGFAFPTNCYEDGMPNFAWQMNITEPIAELSKRIRQFNRITEPENTEEYVAIDNGCENETQSYYNEGPRRSGRRMIRRDSSVGRKVDTRDQAVGEPLIPTIHELESFEELWEEKSQTRKKKPPSSKNHSRRKEEKARKTVRSRATNTGNKKNALAIKTSKPTISFCSVVQRATAIIPSVKDKFKMPRKDSSPNLRPFLFSKSVTKERRRHRNKESFGTSNENYCKVSEISSTKSSLFSLSCNTDDIYTTEVKEQQNLRKEASSESRCTKASRSSSSFSEKVSKTIRISRIAKLSSRKRSPSSKQGKSLSCSWIAKANSSEEEISSKLNGHGHSANSDTIAEEVPKNVRFSKRKTNEASQEKSKNFVSEPTQTYGSSKGYDHSDRSRKPREKCTPRRHLAEGNGNDDNSQVIKSDAGVQVPSENESSQDSSLISTSSSLFSMGGRTCSSQMPISFSRLRREQSFRKKLQVMFRPPRGYTIMESLRSYTNRVGGGIGQYIMKDRNLISSKGDKPPHRKLTEAPPQQDRCKESTTLICFLTLVLTIIIFCYIYAFCQQPVELSYRF